MGEQRNPSLAAGSTMRWEACQKKPGWRMSPHAGGIEAFLGKAGLSGNWAAGYVIIDWARRPLVNRLSGLEDAIRFVESKGEQLALERDRKERAHVAKLAAEAQAKAKEKEACKTPL